ncbi:hypothetical protein HMPREF1529_00554 [Microbacterium sp. oral taxon 186 str. F0373]|jgi:predicted NBD/HSP70 family sugar kinase|uniref:ROK family transcriptional regulator n=1 Tax=Microbacterium sp. oral taxon 186 TaxID=712383 RepID=UPI00034EB9EA|nr:ROK family transcriptional regulator [Microbacterium sp. oral taxon 186]EPD86502.1 hypothetical protein HMPREF1529_00554 [Microbacterium sp. oral taxon 186 str. F0373]
MNIPAGPAAATSNATLRGNNLALVSTLVHRSGPLSRAELTAQTGLSRSAIAGLIGELVDLGWVTEEAPAPSGRIGRPSPIVMPGRAYAAVGVHIDADAITVGLVGLGGELLRRIRVDVRTPPTPVEAVRTVGSIVEGLRLERAERSIIGIGVAVPGLVDAESGDVRWTPRLGWSAVAIGAQMERALGIPALVGNDCSLEGIAEARFGVARGIDDVVYVAGHASGIGGGVIVGGVPLQGASGYAAELGHTLVRTGGALCRCGRRGCLEAEVSLDGLLEILGRSTIDQDELDIELGTSRDPRLLAEVTRQTALLAEGMSTFIHLFNPRMVVLGGFLGSLLSAGRERLSVEVSSRTLSEFRRSVRIERAALRSRLELVGATEPLFDRALADPAAAGAIR